MTFSPARTRSTNISYDAIKVVAVCFESVGCPPRYRCAGNGHTASLEQVMNARFEALEHKLDKALLALPQSTLRQKRRPGCASRRSSAGPSSPLVPNAGDSGGPEWPADTPEERLTA